MSEEQAWWEHFENGTTLDKSGIEQLLPHRGHMLLLNRISFQEGNPVSYAEIIVRGDEFWTEGHFPVPEKQVSERFHIGPIYPGVLMVESSAQLGTAVWRLLEGDDVSEKTMLLKQVDQVKFIKDVRPGDKLLIRCELIKHGRRLMRCQFEGVVFKNGNSTPELCFTCQASGMTV